MPIRTVFVNPVTYKDGEGNAILAERQGTDIQLTSIISHLKEQTLPDDEKSIRELTMNKKQYVLIDNIMYPCHLMMH